MVDPAPDRPSYRWVLKPAFLTTAACLVAFGLAHVAFITWVPTASQLAGEPQPPLAQRLLVMFAAPVLVGIPFALIAALAGAAAYRQGSGTRLSEWRYGAVAATALLPPAALATVHGPYGDAVPGGLGFALLFGAMLALPAALGVLLAGPRGALVALAVVPFALPWTMFLLGVGLVGWVVPFFGSLVVIVTTSGWLMGKLVARAASRRA